MEKFEHKLINGDEVSVEQIQNDNNGNKRYLIKSLNKRWDMFTYTPDGEGESDYLNDAQKLVIEEISILFHE